MMDSDGSRSTARRGSRQSPGVQHGLTPPKATGHHRRTRPGTPSPSTSCSHWQRTSGQVSELEAYNGADRHTRPLTVFTRWKARPSSLPFTCTPAPLTSACLSLQDASSPASWPMIQTRKRNTGLFSGTSPVAHSGVTASQRRSPARDVRLAQNQCLRNLHWLGGAGVLHP